MNDKTRDNDNQEPETPPAGETGDLASGMLDAINQGLQEEAGGAPAQSDTETETDDAGEEEPGETAAETDQDADDDGQEDEPAEEEEPGEADSEQKEDKAAGKEGDKDKGKGKEKAAGKKKDGAAEEDGKPTEPDPVNDPLPEGLKKQTRQRIETLITKVKETSGELETIRQERDDLLGMVVETGTTPEQFNGLLNYLRNVNSEDPEQRKQALQYMQQQMEQLATELGEDAPGVDPLARHEDLRRAVEEGEITEAHAKELAIARNQRQRQESRKQESSHQDEARRTMEAAVQKGRQQLNDLEAELKDQDPDYARKREILLRVLKPIMGRLPPDQWATTFKQAYQDLQLPAAEKPTRTRPAQQPMRPSQPAGHSAKKPSSMTEAIEAGLEEASRR